MKDQTPLKLFKDEPENENLKFAHDVIVNWIYDAILNSPRPYRLAITRSLGAGKTTIINSVKKRLEDSDGYLVSTIDVWKLDKDSSRRSTLIRLAEDLGIKAKEISELKENLYGSTSDISKAKSHKTFIDKTSLIVWFIVSLIFAVIAFFLLGLASGNTELTFRFGVAFFTMLLSLSLKLIDRTFISVQRTFNRAPLVGAEEFEQSLRQIIDNKKLKDKKILLVFDNIDRASFDKTEEILTGISAFFDHHNNKNKNLVILVPFAIGSQSDLTTDTVQKFFDSVIPIPELVPEDLTDYTKELLSSTSWDQEINNLAELITFGPYYTPRELKHFINKFLATFDLAKRMENNVSENHETYLTNGTITNYPLVLAKLMICDDIQQNILINSVKKHLSINDIFEWDKIKNRLPEYKTNELLQGFLIATEGLPQDVPISPDPFLYFKGADALINISGAQEIAKSLTEGRSSAVTDYLDTNKTEGLSNLNTILQITLKKYKGNDQRVKNAIQVILSCFVNEIPNSIKSQIANAIREKLEFLKEVDLYDLTKVTPEDENGIENVDLWGEVDRLYKERFNDEEMIEKFYDWMISYLDIVIKQDSGIDRAEITSNLLKADFFFNQVIIDSMGDRYPLNLVSKEHLIETFEKIKTNDFYKSKQFHIDNLSKFIQAGISSVDLSIKTNITQFFQGLWSLISSQINTPQFDHHTFKSIIGALDGIPLDEKADANAWAQLTNHLNTSHTVLNSKFNAGLKTEIIAFIISINRKVKIVNLGNLRNTVTNTFVPQMDIEVIKHLKDLLGDWEWTKDIDEICSPQLLAILKNEEISSYILKNGSGSIATIFLNNFNNFKDLRSLSDEFEKLKDESDSNISKNDIIKKILEAPSIMGKELRNKAFEFKSQLNIEDDSYNELISFEVKSIDNIERGKYLIAEINKQFSKNTVDEFEKGAKEQLLSFSGTSFSEVEACQFLIATSNFSNDTDTYLKELFDIAIQKGIMDCNDESIVIVIYEQINTIFLNDKVIDKGIFASMEKALRNSPGLDHDSQKELGDELKSLKKKNFKSLLG